MDLNLEKLKSHRPLSINKKFRYAVNLPIVYLNGRSEFLFELRSKDLPVQPGDVCLPGGGLEKGETYLEACMRESSEELGIPESKIEKIAELDYLNGDATTIRVFLTKLNIESLDEIKYSVDEVERVFTVPIDYFVNTEPNEYPIKKRFSYPENFPFHMIHGGKNYRVRDHKQSLLLYNYEGLAIWGMTARIVKHSVELFIKKGVI